MPLALLINYKKRNKLFLLIAFYGVLFFFFLHFWRDFPHFFKRYRAVTYTLLEYSFFAGIILYHIKNIKIRKIILLFSLIFLLFQIFYFSNSKPQMIDSIPIGVESIFIFLFSFFYFQQYLKYNISRYVYEYPSFWLTIGILIYLGSSFFFNILANHVTEDQFNNYWHLTYIPEIIKNIIFAMVILGIPSYANEEPELKRNSIDIPNLDMI